MLMRNPADDKAPGCSLLLAIWLITSIGFITVALTNYRIGYQMTEDGYCSINNVVLQHIKLFQPQSGDINEYRAFYDVNFFSTNDADAVPLINHAAAISEIDDAGWDTSLNAVKKEMDTYKISNTTKYECVKGARTLIFASDDDKDVSYLIVLGSDAKEVRSKFLGCFITGIILSSIGVMTIFTYFVVKCRVCYIERRPHKYYWEI